MKDWRNIIHGNLIPKENYCDQPYVVVTPDGNWVCVMTTGKGEEGERDQHIVATVSKDQGRTWSPLIDIEPPGPPEASWVTPFLAPSGRIYAFYTYNAANIERVAARYEWAAKRVDTLGEFVFKYSDDGGFTWSDERYTIPVREFRIDQDNPYRGEVRFFWSVCKPIVHKGSLYIGLAKVGSFGDGFMESSEGAFVRSDNLLIESDPSLLRWETLPDGDVGLRAPESAVADEHNLVSMHDGSLYCTYRTTEGHNCHAYSRDDGRTWTPPAHAVYTPGGRKIKHPRAANFVRKFGNGKYILWFHNHGKNWASEMTPEKMSEPYELRNPVWLAGGVERNGFIHWSQPELMLYADDPATRISYPDFIEDQGKYFITETQKTIARVHEIDSKLLEGMWSQAERRIVETKGLALELSEGECAAGAAAACPKIPDLRAGGGFTLEVRLLLDSLSQGQIIADCRGSDGIGIVLYTTDAGTVQLELNDGRTRSSWDCDPGLLTVGVEHHITAIVDGGAKIISFVVDGELCDGGTYRQFGFGRFNPYMRSLNGSSAIRIAANLQGAVKALRFYDRYLTVTEAVGNYQAAQMAD
ncbi:Concanavalin A-like lectin/glucanases superfamily protein [Paenibacillus sp. UNCCL117]|uniref:exo-alpha-sialidase n=1 Tax=unclassified Paenibacillus TaxID=185978 RepID=UPI000889FE7F|nr:MULTISPECIES: exo-alpha-sialidase [unclassified Paenibacillus]SDE26618.1 Concanavalin A-like lectin/glucanases superfamily protein [Paenibacillus sp. cl123]SFW62665.1 Concanavalin A-like lectin/glucanases superfamily protein [Paenibacillus sp. UNCCL117]